MTRSILRATAGSSVALAALTLAAGAASAQEAPASAPASAQTPAPSPAAGQWRAFSRSGATVYLIDLGRIAQAGSDTTVQVARVPMSGPAGDYSHQVNAYVIRCGAAQARQASSMDVTPEGEPTEAFPIDEPFEAVGRGGYFEAIKEAACGEAVPDGAPFPSIRAFVDAGRR